MEAGSLTWIDRLRRVPLVTAPLALGYCLVAKRGGPRWPRGADLRQGARGAELLISLSVMAHDAGREVHGSALAPQGLDDPSRAASRPSGIVPVPYTDDAASHTTVA